MPPAADRYRTSIDGHKSASTPRDVGATAVTPDPEATPLGERPLPHTPRGRLSRAVAFAGCLAFAVAFFAHYHNQQWNYYDDGVYLHVADRMLAGEVLHRDVQDMHAGYINFANALALKLFGNDAVSLRYPLALMGVVGAVIAFRLLEPAGTACAAAGSVAATVLSVVQFNNPSANWYALFVTLLIGAFLTRPEAKRPSGQVVVGVLLGLVTLFRQLSGVFAAAGVIVWLLLQISPGPAPGRSRLARLTLVVLGLGLAVYLYRKTDVVAFLLYGVWPLAVVAWAVVHVRAPDGATARLLLNLFAGGLIALAPLLAYHVVHGSVGAWLDDTVFGALSLTQLSFFEYFSYGKVIGNNLRKMAAPEHSSEFFIGLFWAVTPLLPVVLGWSVLRSLRDSRRQGAATSITAVPAALASPLPLLGLFYFTVALHLQKWMYLFFAMPVTVIGLLVMARSLRPVWRRAVIGAVWVVSLIGFLYLARPLRVLLRGNPDRLVTGHGIPRCDLALPPFQVEMYRELLGVLDREAPPGASILTLPLAPELYYLSGRRNPTRFYLPAIGLRTEAEVRAVIERLEKEPPRLVFYAPNNGYNTPASRRLRDWFVKRAEPVGVHRGYVVYRHRGEGSAAAGRSAAGGAAGESGATGVE